MTSNELKQIISLGETSKVQFKRELDNADKVAAELIAMSNSKGGIIIFGVEDKTGAIIGLEYTALQTINNRIATIANELVKPQVYLTTESVLVDDRFKLLVVYIEGESGRLYIDEMIVPGTGEADIDPRKVDEYLHRLEKFAGDLSDIQDRYLYQNLGIVRNDRLTLGGLLFFAKNPQRYEPAFCIKAVAFYGNNIGGNVYKDSRDITGTIPEMFRDGMSFFKANLLHRQNGQNFNSTGILEVSEVTLEELLQNALVHRDYTKNAPVRLLIFDNRIEIISPGCLPNSLTVENIKLGQAVARNHLLVSYCAKMMIYRGIGSGIARAFTHQPDIELVNDTEGEQFIVTLPRKTIE